MPTPSDRVILLARAWAVRQPELETRLQRAVALVPGVTQGKDAATFDVRGSSDVYTVSIDITTHKSRCTCPDSRKAKRTHCKHQLAVGLVLALRAEGVV